MSTVLRLRRILCTDGLVCRANVGVGNGERPDRVTIINKCKKTSGQSQKRKLGTWQTEVHYFCLLPRETHVISIYVRMYVLGRMLSNDIRVTWSVHCGDLIDLSIC